MTTHSGLLQRAQQINKELKAALNNVGDGDSGDEMHHDDHPNTKKTVVVTR